jgi:hypothetical protein
MQDGKQSRGEGRMNDSLHFAVLSALVTAEGVIRKCNLKEVSFSVEALRFSLYSSKLTLFVGFSK